MKTKAVRIYGVHDLRLEEFELPEMAEDERRQYSAGSSESAIGFLPFHRRRIAFQRQCSGDSFHAPFVPGTAGNGIFPFVDKSLVTGSPDDPDRIFSSEVIFALSHSQRNTLFKNYYDPSRIPNYVFRMDNDLMSNIVFGGGAMTGGNQDDYRYRVNWVATGANRYFYKYSDMADVGNIRNTMIPMIRLAIDTRSDPPETKMLVILRALSSVVD